MSQTIYRPGQRCPRSGQYAALNASYRRTREVTVVRGEPFPPTRTGEIGYVLADPTQHARI